MIKMLATINVAATTAIPAPCGVGTRCDDRAFGLANEYRTSRGRSARVINAESTAASITASSIANNSNAVIRSEVLKAAKLKKGAGGRLQLYN
jgi:hypothetical protein